MRFAGAGTKGVMTDLRILRNGGNAMYSLPSRWLRTTALLSLSFLVVSALCTFGAFWQPASEEVQKTRRLEMVSTQIEARGVKDKAVLAALRKVPRHRFVPAMWQGRAYTDGPLPIGEGQTISQPYIVGWMTELIEPTKKMRVLEIGTGSGYQAAVLAECVGEVDTIEVVPALGKKAKGLLGELGYRNIQVRIGDGYEGWPERAPYDAIIVTAAPPTDVPRPLLEQLKPGGRLVAPIGRGDTKPGPDHKDPDRVRAGGPRPRSVCAHDRQGAEAIADVLRPVAFRPDSTENVDFTVSGVKKCSI